MPSIHEEWVDAIYRVNKNPNLRVLICIDNQEIVYRQGYGNLNSIKELCGKNALVKHCENLRICFIGIDDLGCSLFYESRIISGDQDGPNAFQLDRSAADNIIESFFPEEYANLFELDGSPQVEPLKEGELAAVENKLLVNPPVGPDLQREISTYNTLFQYAELHFEGGNISSKTLTIPPSALPFKNSELKARMKTRFNLFTKEM